MSGEASRDVGRRAARSAVALAARQVLVHGLNLAGGILLARLLLPEDFGVYAIIAFFVSLSAILSELGLGYALIRQPQDPTADEYRAVFTFQAALSAILVALLWMAAPLISGWFRMGGEGALIVRASSLNILVSAFQSMAAVSIQRRLDFGRLARAEVIQTAIYHAVTVSMAFAGHGAWSFVVGALARSAAGALVLGLVAPWPIGLRWDWPAILAKARPGLWYQASGLVNMVRDSIVPAAVGRLAGPAGVGYVTFALTLSLYTNALLNILNRLYLPVFSRLLHDRRALGEALGRVVAWTNRVSAAPTVFLLVYGRETVAYVFKEDWLPALPLIHLILVSNAVVATSTPCFGLLNALGEVRRTLGYSVLWACLTWAIGLPLIGRFGFVGFGWTLLLVGFTNAFLFRDCARRVEARLLANAVPPWLLAGALGAAAWWVKGRFPAEGIFPLALHGAAWGGAYALIVWAASWRGIERDIRLFSGRDGGAG